jgi:hypothetical protein
VVTAILVLLGVMWVYALFVAPPASEDKLHDAAFGAAAQPVCAATVDRFAQLGIVNQRADSPAARATLVDQADAELRSMIDQLRALPVSNRDDQHAVSGWLADWDQWLNDRGAWSEKLHAGQDAPFLEKQRDTTAEPNSKALDAFAITNAMPACATPVGV